MTRPLAEPWSRFVPAAVAGLLLVGAAFAIQLLAELAAPPAVSGHHDLLAFWAAGRLILEGRPGDLYDAAALTAIQRTVIAAPIGMNGYMPYINPPFAAAAFAPLGALPEPVARIAWAGLNVALAAAAAAWLSRGLPGGTRVAGAVLVATSYPVIHALAEGQWSIVLLGAGLVALEAARRGRWGLCGLALAAFWLKPQFIVLPLLLLVLGRRWRAVGTAMATGAAAVLVALPLTGLESNRTYLAYLVDVVASHFTGAGAGAAAAWQGDLASTEGLNGILVGWFGQSSTSIVNVAWLALVLALAGAYGFVARTVRPGFDAAPRRAMLAAGAVVVLLVNPNQFVQDCALVFVALDALGPLPSDRRLPAIVATVAVADLTWLDLQVPALHLFAIALVLGVGWILRRVSAGSAIAVEPTVP